MADQAKKSKGWYLGMPYMGDLCLGINKLAHVPRDRRNISSIYCEDILLSSPDWRHYISGWLLALGFGGTLILWIKDPRFFNLPANCQRLTLDELKKGVVWAIGDGEKACARRGESLQIATGEILPWVQFDFAECETIDGHSFIVVHKRLGAAKLRKARRNTGKNALVMRSGAYGDALMASSILPALKAEGWTITFMTREQGYEVLLRDPHIDEFLVLNKNQYNDGEMADFWAAWAPRFDRVINLSLTIEDRFLKRPARADFYWSDAQRRAVCAGSYLGFTHEVAEIPGPYRVKFYPSDTEASWAKTTAEKLGPFVMWSLQGSAIHKWWPHTPKAVCQLLARTDAKIVLCGDEAAQDLANAITQAAIDYFGDASRLRSLISQRSFREVCALAQHAALVVGPETGLLHAVCMEAMPKIVMLSHSAASNLTDDWVNTTALVPTSPCYPCHRLHYSHDFCPQDAATGAAACAASISPEKMVEAALSALMRPHKQQKMVSA